MIGNMKNISTIGLVFVFIALTILGGCASRGRVTNRRAPTETLRGAMLNQITVEDLRVTCDLMARDLILQPFVYNGKSIPIITVKPIENKTDLTIDPDIFQKTIRVKLMEKAAGKILFRDDDSYNYTLDERMKQSGGKVQISTTTTRKRRRKPTGIGQPIQIDEESQTKTTIVDEEEVEKRVADVDYFLTGFIFSTSEIASSNAGQGMKYFQFQFRITDANTNIIVWEKEYLVKRQGRFK